MGLPELLLFADASFQRISGPLNVVVVALVILLFGFIIGKIVDRILRRFFADIRFDEVITRWRGVKRNYARASRHAVVRTIYAATIILALQWLSLLLYVAYALLAIVALVAVVSSAFWLRDLMPNISGRVRLQERRLREGDEVTIVGKTGVVSGTVRRIGAMSTRVSRQNGDIFFIPNATLAQDRIVQRRIPKST